MAFRLPAARELGRVLVVRLDEWAQEMLEAATVRENYRMGNDLVGPAEWIGSAEGYGNFFSEETLDFRVGIARSSRQGRSRLGPTPFLHLSSLGVRSSGAPSEQLAVMESSERIVDRGEDNDPDSVRFGDSPGVTISPWPTRSAHGRHDRSKRLLRLSGSLLHETLMPT